MCSMNLGHIQDGDDRKDEEIFKTLQIIIAHVLYDISVAWQCDPILFPF